jgi:hypothetical protein
MVNFRSGRFPVKYQCLTWKLGWWRIYPQGLSFTYETWLIPRPGRLATSPAFPGRWIERSSGLDRASSSHFAQNPLIYLRINPQFNNRASPRRADHTQTCTDSWKRNGGRLSPRRPWKRNRAQGRGTGPAEGGSESETREH